MSIKRAAGAVVAATVLTALLATHGFTSVPIVRVKALRAPVSSTVGPLIIPLPVTDYAAGLRPPVALIWDVRNDADRVAAFELDVDGKPVCRTSVKAHAEPRFGRVDCILSDPHAWDVGGAHTAEIRSDAPAWTLTYLEAATHEGRLSDPLNLLLLPRDSTVFVRPGFVELVITWVVVVGLLLVPPPVRRARRWLVAQRIAAGLALGVLAIVVVVPVVSPYNVVLSTATFGRMIVLFLGWRIWVVGTVGVRTIRDASPVARARYLTAVAALVVAAGYGQLVGHLLADNYHGNYSGFLHIAAEHFDHNPILPDRETMRPELIIENPGGYDGQFIYLMTFDPFLWRFHRQPAVYNAVVDAPPYRYGRIGLSVLTKLVSLDQWPRYPAVIVWLVLLALVAAAVTLSAIAWQRGASPLWGAAILVIPGFWESLQTGLPEPIAAALILGAVWCVFKERWVLGAVLCAASLLTRETGVIIVGCLAAWAWMTGRRSAAVRFAAIALAPMALWRLYVGWTLYPVWGHQAFLYSPDDLGLPFLGIANLWQRVAGGTYYPGHWEMTRSAMAYPLLLMTGLAFAAMAAVLVPSPFAVAGIVYGLIGLSLRYGSIWVHVGNGQRGTFDLFLMLALVSVSMAGSPRLLRNLRWAFWILAAAYVFFGSFDATIVRHAVLPLG